MMDDVREQALAEAKRTYAGFITFLKWVSFIFIALILVIRALRGACVLQTACVLKDINNFQRIKTKTFKDVKEFERSYGKLQITQVRRHWGIQPKVANRSIRSTKLGLKREWSPFSA